MNLVVEKLFITWNQCGDFTQDLIDKLKNQQFDRVVGISRGGLVPAVSLSHHFNAPLSIVGVSSYNDITNEQQTLVCDTPDVIFDGWKGSILIVDDVVDTGTTFQFLLDKVRSNDKITVTTAALHYKEGATVRPDVFCKVTDQWVVYPWESTRARVNQ